MAGENTASSVSQIWLQMPSHFGVLPLNVAPVVVSLAGAVDAAVHCAIQLFQWRLPFCQPSALPSLVPVAPLVAPVTVPAVSVAPLVWRTNSSLLVGLKPCTRADQPPPPVTTSPTCQALLKVPVHRTTWITTPPRMPSPNTAKSSLLLCATMRTPRSAGLACFCQ